MGVKENALVAVKDTDYFYRGRILETNKDNFKVELLDAGNIKCYTQIFPLMPQFLVLPFQGLRVKLHSTFRKDYSRDETKILKKRIREISQQDGLALKILDIEEDCAVGQLLDTRSQPAEDIC